MDGPILLIEKLHFAKCQLPMDSLNDLKNWPPLIPSPFLPNLIQR